MSPHEELSTSASNQQQYDEPVLAANVETNAPTPQEPTLPPWVSTLQASVQGIAEMLDRRFRQDKTKDEAFDRLYAELDALRRAESVQQMKPLYLDLILLYDRIEQICSAHTDEGLVRILGTIRDELLEVLYRRDVSLIATSTVTFDSSVQQAVGMEPAVNPEGNNLVARIVRRGFRLGERVLRPEDTPVQISFEPRA
jgi:molecular chaperone GrpE